MNGGDVTKEFEKTWLEDKHNYVLVRNKNSSPGYTIMDVIHNTMLIIERNDLAEYVIQKMIEHGVRIVDDFEQVRNSNPPDPIFYTSELEAEYRKWQERNKKK